MKKTQKPHRFTVMIPEKVSLNKIYAGVHWATRKRWKEQYYIAVLSAKIDRYEGEYPIHAHYHFKLHGTQLDASNCAFMAKCVEDALVAASILPGDSPKVVASVTYSSEKAEADEVDVEFSTP